MDLINHNTNEHSHIQSPYNSVILQNIPSIQEESKKKKKKSFPLPSGHDLNSPATKVVAPNFIQSELSFLDIRSKLSEILCDILSNEVRNEEIELANIIIELALVFIINII